MPIGKYVGATPAGNTWSRDGRTFQPYNAVIESNGQQLHGQINHVAGGRAPQSLLGKTISFEVRQTEYGLKFSKPKEIEQNVPGGSGKGGGYDHLGQQIGNCLTNAVALASANPDRFMRATHWMEDIEDIAAKLMTISDNLRQRATAASVPQEGSLGEAAANVVQQQRYAPQEAPAGGYDERNPPPDLEDEIPF